MARAWSAAGDLDAARRWAELGHRTAATIADADDRAQVLGDLATIPGLSA